MAEKAKKAYSAPVLKQWGTVADLTKWGSFSCGSISGGQTVFSRRPRHRWFSFWRF
jgi:hypothetical protein